MVAEKKGMDLSSVGAVYNDSYLKMVDSHISGGKIQIAVTFMSTTLQPREGNM